MRYKTQITMPEEFAAYLAPFLGQGDVIFNHLHERTPGFTFEFEAQDLWEAHELVSDTAREADASYGRMGGHTEFERAEPIAGIDTLIDREPNGAANLREHYDSTATLYHGSEPVSTRTERVYLTPEPNDDANLREHTARTSATRVFDGDDEFGAWYDEGTGERLTAVQATERRAHYVPNPKPGDGATLHVGSDRYPYTISRVELFKSGARQGTPRTVWARLDDYVAATGFRADDGVKRYMPRPDREEVEFIPVKGTNDNRFHRPGDTSVLVVGKRNFYQAPEV